MNTIPKLLRPLVLVSIVLTFLLINLGGHVHNSGSSLACPDWPLCYGQFMPEMIGGVLIEHSHRLLASLVGLCAVVIFFLSRRTPLYRVSLLALALVILQGTLGGLTVIFQLPPLVSTAHLGVAMLFFCTLIYLYQRLQGRLSSSTTLLKISLVALYLQILLGALVRHIGAGGSCGLGEENSYLCLGGLVPETFFEGLHLTHRILALVVGALVLSAGWSLLRRARVGVSALLVALVLLQVWLGTEVISSGLRPLYALLHLSSATLLLGTLWSASFVSRTS